jgi:hypothetical protein
MERPATWKVVTLGAAALTGLSVAGAAQADSGSPGSGPVSPAPLFNEERLLASGSGGGDWGHWDDWGPGNWGPGWFPNVGGCVSATGPFGYVGGSVCI